MRILDLFRSHKHSWGRLSKRPNGQLGQLCAGCGKERLAREQLELLKSDTDSEATVRNILYPPPKDYNRARPRKD